MNINLNKLPSPALAKLLVSLSDCACVSDRRIGNETRSHDIVKVGDIVDLLTREFCILVKINADIIDILVQRFKKSGVDEETIGTIDFADERLAKDILIRSGHANMIIQYCLDLD